MAEQAQTTDHKAIKNFADEHNLKPARVQKTGDGNDGMIRLMQPGSSHSNSDDLQEISWDDWLSTFENNKLALIYEEGSDSSFNKLVSRNQ